LAMARDAASLGAPGVNMACALMTDLLRTGSQLAQCRLQII
jgi:hypothetical protein